MMDPSKSSICLQCGTTIGDNCDKHMKAKKHYLFLQKSKQLLCKKCNYVFEPSELTDKVAELLMEVATSVMEKLPKLMEQLAGAAA